MNQEIKKRLAPFSALLDARYFPLLVAALPQAHTIYKWLWQGSDGTFDSWAFSIIGALGFEMVYVGAIAWAEGKQEGDEHIRWFWLTALTALIFSTVVAAYHYWPTQPGWAILHSGFPIVAFCYTMLIHSATKQEVSRETEAPTPAQPKAIVTSAADSSTPQDEPSEIKAVLEETKELVLVAGGVDSKPDLRQTEPSRQTAICQLRDTGKTWKEIAYVFGISESMARHIAKNGDTDARKIPKTRLV
jgi:hypothetical protein